MTMAGPARPAYFLYHLFWEALDWVFPPACGGCGHGGSRWCEACERAIARIEEPVCIRCGNPTSVMGTCSQCQVASPAYEALRSFAIYQDPLREAIHRLKYGGDVGLGEVLSKHLVELYNQLKWEIDMVVPVPLSSKRLKERGYNQAGMLGRPLAYATQKSYRPGALQRKRETRSQVGLSARERRQNVEGAFRAQAGEVKGKVVLVVDDVTTTGSTISACAQALREAGASAVYGMTLCRAVLQTHTEYQPKTYTLKRR